jgi:hypothetical protein
VLRSVRQACQDDKRWVREAPEIWFRLLLSTRHITSTIIIVFVIDWSRLTFCSRARGRTKRWRRPVQAVPQVISFGGFIDWAPALAVTVGVAFAVAGARSVPEPALSGSLKR